MRRCAWSLVGLLISVRVAEDGTCESMPAPTAQPTTSAPSMTFAPTPTPPYEYAPTVDAMPYCKLSDSSVCWGNTHKFLKVTANGPFDGIDVGWYSAPALADLDAMVRQSSVLLWYIPGHVTIRALAGDLDLVVGDWDGVLNYIENTGTSAAPVFVVRTGSANPFDGINVGVRSAPALGDLDGDGTLRPRPSIDKLRVTARFLSLAGDLDLVVGGEDGRLKYFKNTGSSTKPEFEERTESENPFDGIDVGFRSAPVLGDIDNDGTLIQCDLDLVLGWGGGSLNYVENTGTSTAPVFVLRPGSANPFDGIDVGMSSALGDLDNDGDLDLVLGWGGGSLNYFENIGTSTVPVFVLRPGSANPFDGVDVGMFSAPALGDIDNNGDLDLVVGDWDGLLNYIENTGTSTAPVFVQRSGSASPIDAIDVGYYIGPALGDLDGDGTLGPCPSIDKLPSHIFVARRRF